jgi:hypothetical protein
MFRSNRQQGFQHLNSTDPARVDEALKRIYPQQLSTWRRASLSASRPRPGSGRNGTTSSMPPTRCAANLACPHRFVGNACLELGREPAAIAILSTKPAAFFTRGAGAYFAGMVKKHQRGELNLDRTLWKLKGEKWGPCGEAQLTLAELGGAVALANV